MPVTVVGSDGLFAGGKEVTHVGTSPKGSRLTAFSNLGRDRRLQSMIAVSVLACVVSTFMVRPHHRYDLSLDGALYLIASTVPIVPMILVGRRVPAQRRAWRFMVGGVALNAIADVVYVLHDQRLNPIPNPAPSDVFYLLSYASFILGVAFLTQVNVDGARVSLRMDGVIAGLAVASLVSFGWYAPLLASGGGALHVAVDLAYPMCDLVMLVWLVAAMAPYRFRPSLSTALLIGGFLWFIAGDVLHVNGLASNSLHATSFTDVTFVIGVWLMGLAASAQDRRNWAERGTQVNASLSVAAVPVVSGVIAIGVIAASWIWNRPPEVGGLALAALALVVGRMWLALREERRIVMSSTVDARTDSLTRLPNRRHLFERMDELLRLDGHDGLGLILIDLDGFKEVNDTLGHVAGDEILAIVAHRFAVRLGTRGLLARLGGDEFAAICVCSDAELVTIAQELLTTTNEPYALDGLLVNVGASIGVAVADRESDDPYRLLHRADQAMYEAKRSRSGISAHVLSEVPSCEKHPVPSSIRELIV